MSLEPHYARVPARAGHYESVYLTASHPSEPVAVWIRYTVHKRPGAPPTGSIWFTLFSADGPTAVKVTTDQLSSDGTHLLTLGANGSVRRDGADGLIRGHGVDASWELRFQPVAGELRHLPYAWLYRAPVPRTKSTSPYPSMRVTGTVTVSGHTLVLDGWRGMLGHNWGSEHAHRWIWLRAASFVEQPEAWLDIVIGRIKIGSRVLPWIANGALELREPGAADTTAVRHRVGGPGRRVSVTERRDGCDLVVPGREVTLTLQVNAPLSTSVGWEYADPAGGRHQARNCSIAGVGVEVRRRDHESANAIGLTTGHGGVYELGSAEFDPAVTMQPYPDG